MIFITFTMGKISGRLYRGLSSEPPRGTRILLYQRLGGALANRQWSGSAQMPSSLCFCPRSALVAPLHSCCNGLFLRLADERTRFKATTGIQRGKYTVIGIFRISEAAYAAIHATEFLTCTHLSSRGWLS